MRASNWLTSHNAASSLAYIVAESDWTQRNV